MRTLRVLNLVDKLEGAGGLDGLAGSERRLVNTLIRPQQVRDALHGVWIGHPLHPLLVQVPLGAWMSAAVLDCLPGMEKAATTLVAVGVVTAGPAAAAGYVDFTELHEQHQRVAVVHSTANLTAVVLYGASLARRLSGRSSGRILGLLGLGTVLAGGWLGGHLSFRQAAGANHAEDVPHRVAPGWHDIGALADFEPGTPAKRELGDIPVLVLRTGEGERVRVLADTCSHLSGPLSEGEVKELDGDACIVCPWHNSTFSLRTGEVLQGPATAPQPVFETRIQAGRLEVCLPGAG